MIPFLENRKGFLVEASRFKKCFMFSKDIWYILPKTFHEFDRYEIHIQAFLDFINGKLIISVPHLHKNVFGNM